MDIFDNCIVVTRSKNRSAQLSSAYTRSGYNVSERLEAEERKSDEYRVID